MPPKPGAPPPAYTTVFFRVFVVRADALRVELWDKGEFHGARSVSGEGSRQLRARRIALGAGELVRRLRQKRLAEAKALADERERLAREAAEREKWEQKSTLAFVPAATAAAIGPTDFWLAGPGMSGQARLGGGARLDLGVRFLAGDASAVDDAGVSWFEISLAPSYALRAAPSLDVDLGVLAGAAAVHVSGAAAVDGIAGQSDTWSARAVAFGYVEPRLARWIRLSAGPEVGAVLRSVPVDEEQLGGLWLGVSLALVIDPRGQL